MSLVIGTRGSDLALWQARFVAEALGGAEAGVRIEIVRTQGDRAHSVDLATSSERGLFTRDIETSLLEKRIDVAVHSLKDLPTTLPDGLVVAAVPKRADAGDVLLVRPDVRDEHDRRLPIAHRARVGTGSPRRQALLAWLRPDLVAAPLRGNVPTRVEKCRLGDVDAVILARAGLVRLGLDVAPLVAFDLDPATWVPAPAQGALGIECRADDAATIERVRASLHDEESATCVGVERELLALLEAGCHAALGAWCRRVGQDLSMDMGMLGDDEAWRRGASTSNDAHAIVTVAIDGIGSRAAATPASPCWSTAASW